MIILLIISTSEASRVYSLYVHMTASLTSSTIFSTIMLFQDNNGKIEQAGLSYLLKALG